MIIDFRVRPPYKSIKESLLSISIYVSLFSTFAAACLTAHFFIGLFQGIIAVLSYHILQRFV